MAHEVVRGLKSLLIDLDLCDVLLLASEHKLTFLLSLALAASAMASSSIFLQLFHSIAVP